MRTLLPALAVIALGGFFNQANAQTSCPELVRLRNEALASQQPLMRPLTRDGKLPIAPPLLSDSCVAHVRSAQAWRAVVDYAGENREMCGISEDWLRAYEAYRREAASLRDNICAGRPGRAFPAEIIKR